MHADVHHDVASRFSAERKEAESAGLSAKEECFGRLIEGDGTGGGEVLLASEAPPPPPLLRPRPKCKMPETESDRLHLLPIRNQRDQNPAAAGPWPFRISV